MTSLVDGFVAHLGDPSMSIRSKLNVAIELRDSVEINQVTADQEGFVSQLLPEITRLLESIPVSMVSTSPEHKLRHTLLDVISRLQPNEALRPIAQSLLELVMRIMQVDNEENGIVCMKILTNLHRAYKPQLVDFVQPFLDLVVQIMRNVPQMVHDLFDAPKEDVVTPAPGVSGSVQTPDGVSTPNSSSSNQNPTSQATSGSTMSVGTPQASSSGSSQPQTLFRATHSFKVLTECPIIVVLLFTSHREIATQSLPVLVPHVVEILSLEAAPQAKAHAAAASRGTIFTGVAPALRQSPHRAAYNDFVMSQIKAMSFVAFVIRAFSQALQQHLNLVPNFVVRLLKDCPPEMGSARKELLVSMRHILNTEHRNFFLSKVSVLLDENVLIGSGLTAQENLRPLAYGTMGDLIHHIRNELGLPQVWQTVKVYVPLLGDPSMAGQYQGVSLKLLLNGLDRIASLPKPDQGRQIALTILKAVVDRLSILNKQQSELEQALKRSRSVIHVHPDTPHDDVKEMKYMYRGIILFLRSLIFGIKASNPQPTQPVNFTQWQEAARIFSADGVQLFRDLLRETTVGFRLLSDDTASAKELMDALVTVFMQIDPATFNEVFELEISKLVDEIMINSSLLHFTYLLTGNEATSPGFCTIMLNYLVARLDRVGEAEGATLLKLFKQCFSAVNLFPAANESVILPHLRDLIVKCLQFANNTSYPQRYFALLQHLFRTLGGGRFDNVYKRVLPLLHYLLETLNKRLAVARREEEKNLYADLCLTVPVRLSLMVPHLSFLMRPLAQALGAKNNPELVAQGLRTLELCVDNLTPTYFDPHIEPVLPEVIPALWNHLKPLPYDHKLSHTTLRVLGKLGGRSRAYLSPPADLKYVSPLDQDVAAMLEFEIDATVPVRITPAIKAALNILENPTGSTVKDREAAFRVISVVLLKYIPSNASGLDATIVHDNLRKHVGAEEFSNTPDLPEAHLDKDERRIETDFVEHLLRGLFLACSDVALRPRASDLISDICEHFVLIELGEFNLERRRALRKFNVNEHEGHLYVAPRTLVSAIVYALGHYLPGVPDAGITAIRKIARVSRDLCGDEVETYRYPMFRSIFAKLSHSCFEESWYTKRGAVTGLGIVLREISLPKTWLGARLVELARTLLFVIKDTSPIGGVGAGVVPLQVAQEAADLLMYMIAQVEHKPGDRYFGLLTSMLAYELESACAFCRQTAQRALRYLSEATGVSLNDILSRVTDVFLTPIFMKPLRALPFPMQIGYIDAISFCLSLPDTFLKFNDKLTRLLEEALALVDAEDESLTSATRVFEYVTSQQLTELRVVCIRLLALAITSSDRLATQYPTVRAKIIAVFFKMMASGTAPIVDAAYDGLKSVLQVSHRLPKELLQAGLKPILLPLSDFKRLTVGVLDCLARLLELLTYNFKVEIGTKLLDHLRTFAEPSRLVPLSNRSLEGDERIQVGVALVNVFHMLPPAAHVFIPQLMSSVVSIEESLRRSQVSPFREPAAKFLDKYPAESFAYFFEKLTDHVYGRLFSDMVRRAPHLAEYTSAHLEELCSRVMALAHEEDQCVGICNLIFTVANVTPSRKVLVNLVSSIGDIVRATAGFSVTSPLQLAVPCAITTLQRTVINYLRKNELDFDLINSLVGSVAGADVQFSPEILEYLYDTVVIGHLDVKKLWLDNAIPAAVQPLAHPKAKQYLMTVTNLVLVVHAERHKNLETLVDSWLKRVHEQVWQNAAALIPQEGSPANPVGSGLGVATLDRFFLQLLEMSVLLVRFAAPQIVDVRKDVIKFGWRYITVEDAVSKLSAYVLVNYFVAAFDTLPKIVVQIYIALLKTPQQEARSLVQQALDVLATVIVQRIADKIWAHAPRRILSEDGHGIVGVSNICLFLARHAKLFYPYRDMYVPFIVSAMARLSYMSSQTLDVDLAELLAAWDKERYSSPDITGYEVPHPMREAVTTYLVRFITAQPVRARDPRSAQRVLAALGTLLDLWPDVEIRLHFFDRPLVQTNFSSSPQSLQNALDALHVVHLALSHKSADWIGENINDVAALLEKPLQSNSAQIQDALAPILRRVLAADQDDTILRLVVTAATEHLSPQGSAPPRNVWIKLAAEAMHAKPSSLDEQMGSAIKAVSRMAKDRMDNTGTVDATMLIDALKLVASRVSYLGDQRRSFLTLVAHIVERIPDKPVHLFILDMVRGWVFGSEPFPTVKEKAAIMHKLLVYKDPELTAKYFEIVIGVFEDPRLRVSELPTRLEQPFLVGCSSPDPEIHDKLISILNASVDKTIGKRLVYVLTEQSWEALADQQWLCQALQLVFDPLKPAQALSIDVPLGFAPVSVLQLSQRTTSLDGEDAMDVDPPANIISFVERRKEFLAKISTIQADAFLDPVKSLLFTDNELVHQTWLDVFPAVYKSCFEAKERHELVKGIVMLLAKEYHLRQADKRPNVIQSLLGGFAEAGEQLPPQLSKYLATTYSAWYTAMQLCENIRMSPQSDSLKVAEVNNDALAELYAALGEDDHFYGLWRTRSKFAITSAALSYEQCGMWNRAMQLHEAAQLKARSGALPFGESEYGLWEDHWILCAEKLQHWEILTDIAKHEGFTDLLLECQWRLADWMADRDSLAATIKTVMDVPTPRRQVFETFLSLQGFAQKTDTLQHLSQNVDEGIQLSLHKWHALPQRPVYAHTPLLHAFQQYVEFMEATQVYTSLQSTTALNLEAKSQELKGVMQAWHDRLPNVWDDINLWGDLAAWRQHVFGVINRVYLPLIPQLQAAQGANGGSAASTNSAAYRGYHEIAWTINRFAHTARKQNMPDVCVTQLSKIYTLPNIEIQEAFLKLREQAKCHLQNPNELATGLDVISNTNLAFFGNPQKSEFFALKGESLARLGQAEHANSAFSTAVQIDVYLPKAWAAWGEFNDKRFREHPDNMTAGTSAVVCYLQAAGLYKNRKSRKLIGRLLWLMALDDAQGQIAQAFENFKGDTPTWYWVTYIPQLLTSLSQREAAYTSKILIKIAKAFPQALHFHLRTAREEYAILQRLQQKNESRDVSSEGNNDGNTTSSSPLPDARRAGAGGAGGGTGSGVGTPNSTTGSGTPIGTPGASGGSAKTKQPWEYTDEIMGVLKTAYPLLALSLETLIDQMHHRFKSPPDEDAYRLIVALLNDGISFMGRQQSTIEDQRLPPHTVANVQRFAEGVVPEPARPQFEADFVTQPRPTLDVYIQRLRKWRNRLEAKLDARPYRVNMEALSPPLGEFHYQKFEDVEVPGQNQELKDDNHYFLKIGRFVPHVDLVRSHGICYRRITIEATDGSLHPFAVQYPAARNYRREERVSQVFKVLDSILQRRSETRRRNIRFTLPNTIPLNLHIRMVQDDPKFVSFYHIYEQFCRKRGQSRDAPFDYTIENLRAAFDPQLSKPDVTAVKMEILAGIQSKLVPHTIMRDFFLERYRSFEDFWLFRRQFAYQYAGVSFMTVMMSINNRYPHKFLVNMASGNVWATEMLPIVPQTRQAPTYLSGEPVAFRLTPNIQTLMSQHVTEGVFAPTMMIIAKGVTDPEFDLSMFLPVYVRDELISWYAHQLNHSQRIPHGAAGDQGILDLVKQNVDAINRRASSLAQSGHANSAANQTALDLISLAVNPRSLALTDILWMPYY